MLYVNSSGKIAQTWMALYDPENAVLFGNTFFPPHSMIISKKDYSESQMKALLIRSVLTIYPATGRM